MAKNYLLRPRTIQDIDNRIERVLRGLGNPEPPLRLEDVRELLKLDRQFYTADDPSLAREVVSRIRVAAIQVFKRPMLLVDVIRKASIQALYLPDQRRILLDQNVPEKKHRWSEAHEVTHSLLPWHEEVMHGDTAYTMSQDCQEQVEAEANYGAGRLLFLQDRFVEEASDMPLTLASVQTLRGTFKNTISSTLWRFVEANGKEKPLVGLITAHPYPPLRPPNFDARKPCRHCIQSAAFAGRFSKVTEQDLFTVLASYCAPRGGGPLGSSTVVLPDDNGDEHLFSFETFFIRYRPPAMGEALTLGVYLGRRATSVAV